MSALRRKVAKDPEASREATKVTDWIQALTVVIGVAIAVWQLVIVDRDSERQRRRAVSELILAAQSEQFVGATRAMLEWAHTTRPPDETLRAQLLPIELHYQTWTFCIAHDLCDRELAQSYVCTPLVAWDALVSKQRLEMDGLLFPRGPDFSQVLEACTKRVAQASAATPASPRPAAIR